MLRNNIIWGWICGTTFRSHVIKHFSRFYLQYNDKWNNLFFPWVNTFSIYNSVLRVRVGYCFYTSSSFRSFIFRLYKRWTWSTLIFIITACFYTKLGIFFFKSIPLPLPYSLLGKVLHEWYKQDRSIFFKNPGKTLINNKFIDKVVSKVKSNRNSG